MSAINAKSTMLLRWRLMKWRILDLSITTHRPCRPSLPCEKDYDSAVEVGASSSVSFRSRASALTSLLHRNRESYAVSVSSLCSANLHRSHRHGVERLRWQLRRHK